MNDKNPTQDATDACLTDRHQNPQIQAPNQSSQEQPTESRISYVSAARSTPQSIFPKKDQAIVMHALEQIKIVEYVKSIGAIVGARNIIFASRISNNRICIYLANSQTVDVLLNSHESIKVADTEVPIRRLVTPAKRLLISNVCPSIPHEILEAALKGIGLKLVSPISFLRAGIPGEEFNHILSFRRQVYVSPPQGSHFELQTSIVISFDETSYRIFISTDSTECYLCKKLGHIASNCPQTNQPFPELDYKKLKRPAPPSSLAEDIIVQDSQEDCNNMGKNNQEFKKPSQPHERTNIGSRPQLQPAKKKPKKSSPKEEPEKSFPYHLLEKLFAAAPENYSIPYQNFKSFLENSFGNQDPLAEAHRYTNDVPSLLTTIKDVYSKVNDRTLRNRFTRLSKRIRKQLLEGEDADVVSIASSSSQMSVDDPEAIISDREAEIHSPRDQLSEHEFF